MKNYLWIIYEELFNKSITSITYIYIHINKYTYTRTHTHVRTNEEDKS